MERRLYGDYMVGKIDNKFYIFYMRASLGGVSFSQASQAFHTEQEAKLFLIEKIKEDSTPETKLLLVEVVNHYMLIGETNEPELDDPEVIVGIEL